MSEKSQPHTMNRTLFKVAIEGYPYLFWQPDCDSDVVIITRGHLNQINDYGRGLVGLRAPAHRHLRERRARDQDGVRRVAEDS